MFRLKKSVTHYLYPWLNVIFLIVYAVSFLVGVSRNWLAPILNEASDPHSELPLTTEQCSWMASLSGLTRGASPILFFFLLDRVGRNPIVTFNAIGMFGVWIGVYCSRNVYVHYVLRLLYGLCNGLQYMVSSIYVCENCSPKFRATFSAIVVLSRHGGQTVVFVLAAICSYSDAATIVYIILGFIALLSTLLLVEPPQYLLMKGNEVDAEKNFARLRDLKDEGTVMEFEAIKKNVEEEKKRTFNAALYRSKEVLKSVRIVVILNVLFTGSGQLVIHNFMTKLFSNARGDDDGFMSANELSIFCSLLQFFSAGAFLPIMDQVNRRTMIIVSSALTCFIHAGIVILYCLKSVYDDVSNFRFILFVLFSIFSCICTSLQLPMVILLGGELLPQSIKRVGAGLNTMTGSMIFFVGSLIYLPIAEAFGTEINFIIFFIFSVSLTSYAYIDVPETRGKTLVEIQNILKKG